MYAGSDLVERTFVAKDQFASIVCVKQAASDQANSESAEVEHNILAKTPVVFDHIDNQGCVNDFYTACRENVGTDRASDPLACQTKCEKVTVIEQ